MFIIHRPTPRQLGVGGVILMALLLPILFQNSSYSYVIRIFGLVGLYMMIALGLNIVLGFLGLLDLGFMAFYAIGAYSMALLSGLGWGFCSALVAGIILIKSGGGFVGAPGNVRAAAPLPALGPR